MHFAFRLLPVAALLPLSACVAPAIIAATGGTGGYYAAQERPIGNSVDDAGIRLKLNELYIEKNAADMFKNIAIDVSEGRVMLTGSVVRAETAKEAVRLAWTAKNVKEVLNEIQVTGGTGVWDYTQDGWISTEVKSRMLFDKNIRSVNYTVETVNQHVYILGIARNQEELERVATIASTTKYVKEVVSHVILQDDPRRGADRTPQAAPGATQGAAASPQIYTDSYDADHPIPRAPVASPSYGNADGGAYGDNAAASTSMYGSSTGGSAAAGGGGIRSSDLPPPSGR